MGGKYFWAYAQEEVHFFRGLTEIGRRRGLPRTLRCDFPHFSARVSFIMADPPFLFCMWERSVSGNDFFCVFSLLLSVRAASFEGQMDGVGVNEPFLSPMEPRPKKEEASKFLGCLVGEEGKKEANTYTIQRCFRQCSFCHTFFPIYIYHYKTCSLIQNSIFFYSRFLPRPLDSRYKRASFLPSLNREELHWTGGGKSKTSVALHIFL